MVGGRRVLWAACTVIMLAVAGCSETENAQIESTDLSETNLSGDLSGVEIEQLFLDYALEESEDERFIFLESEGLDEQYFLARAREHFGPIIPNISSIEKELWRVNLENAKEFFAQLGLLVEVEEGEAAESDELQGEIYEIEALEEVAGFPVVGSTVLLRFYSVPEQLDIGETADDSIDESNCEAYSFWVGDRSIGLATRGCEGLRSVISLDGKVVRDDLVPDNSWARSWFHYEPCPSEYSLQLGENIFIPGEYTNCPSKESASPPSPEVPDEAQDTGSDVSEPIQPEPTPDPEPTPEPDPEPSVPNYVFQPVGSEVIAPDGMSVKVTELSKNQKTGSTQLTVVYTMNNRTSSEEIIEGSFKLFFDDGSSLNQYGGFNYLYPGDTSTRRYTFEWTGTKRASLIEYEADFFAAEPSGTGLKWSAPD